MEIANVLPKTPPVLVVMRKFPPYKNQWGAVFSCAVVFALCVFTGCGETSSDARNPASQSTVEPPPDTRIEVVELNEENAAREAERVRSEVSVTVMDGFDLDLWASERLLSDPVGLDIDDNGRVYVTQTFRRRGQGEVDIRYVPKWRIPTLALETVDDRRAFYREHLAPELSDQNQWLGDFNGDGSHDWRDLTVKKERILTLEDTSGDGLADRAQVFFEGFNEEVSDVAGGILKHDQSVYVAVSPDLWRLRDTTGDGWADSKESIAHGFGVHFGFAGHGMSGVTLGPDGRIYWAIGDLGANVTAPDGTKWTYPNCGVVARANPDGSDFEIFATGLRNTHELAFDEHGNLISVDNDGDHAGEHERIVYLIHGSDSGWRLNWQLGKYDDPDNNAYKVWMDEGLYKPRFPGQAAYILPPVAAFTSGPSGLAYNPGTALSPRWRDFVFVSEFTGAPARSHLSAFRLAEKGAGFRLAEEQNLLTGLQITSLAFGPDGALYFSDWVEGWVTNGKGRIWKLDTPEFAGSEIRAETEHLLRKDFETLSLDALEEMLHYEDMRVRQKSQFELVRRSGAGAEILLQAARQTKNRLARLHGLWGLGQLIREGEDWGEHVVRFLNDNDAEVRTQAARVLGDVRYRNAGNDLLALLRDEAPRVRLAATEALGRMGYEPAVGAIAEMLVENDDQDVYLRHAGAIALAGIGEAEPIVGYADHPSRALRIAGVVALRRMRQPEVAAYLSDDDEWIVTEAARAIHDDQSIPAALPTLARVLEGERFANEALLRRAISANLRLGTPEEAQRVAAFAGRSGAPTAMRIEALRVLGVWPRPSVLDRVDGWYRGARQRDPAAVRQAARSVLESLLQPGVDTAIQVEAIETAAKLELNAVSSALLSLVQNGESGKARAAALSALARLGNSLLGKAVTLALGDEDAEVRRVALRLAPTVDETGEDLVGMLAQVVEEGSVREQQAALETLGELKGGQAKTILNGYLDRLLAREFSPALQLELLEAAEATGEEELREKIARYHRSKAGDEVPEGYRAVLHGGNAEEGRKLFRENPSTSCTRCHSVDGQGESVGPDLAQVGEKLTRANLVEALIDPSARIAPGYGAVTLVLKDGRRVTGTLLKEGESSLTLEVSGEESRIGRAEIVDRENAPSSMPPMGMVLSKKQLRDLVEYLANLK